jgi:PKD domain/Bacterial Ig domain
LSIGTVKRCPIALIDRSFNAGVVGFRGSTQPTKGNPTVNSKDWTQWKQPVDLIESLTGLDFLSGLSDNVENRIEANKDFHVYAPTAPLQADRESVLASSQQPILFLNLPVGHDGAIDYDTVPAHHEIEKLSTAQIGLGKVDIIRDGFKQLGSHQFGTSQISISQIGSGQVGIFQSGSFENSTSEISFSQVSSSQVGIPESSSNQVSFSQVGFSQIGYRQVRSDQISLTQIDSRKLNPVQIDFSQVNPTEISLPSSITIQQLLTSHNPNLQNTAVPTWTEFLQSPTPFNLKIEIQDLPTGQLASGTITGYDTNGRPNSGTLTLDTDGNSLGWFIDTTPDDNSEFTTQLADTAFRATTGAAAGKYDLLTTILHELGHLNGIISGNTAFDTHVQNINGIPTFIDGGITATLTPDGSHLNSTLYPYDLMNTSLKPGVRKLPSALDLSILNTLWSNKATTSQQINTTAHLTTGALIGITNGDFTTPITWNTAGATNIINGTATLTEQSQKLSELTQAFIIPTGAKTLQFTIKDNHLVGELGSTGVGGNKAPDDAFEVALLDTNTFNPLAGTIGLTHSDSLLNIQVNGTIHKSDKVTITALGNNSSIVTIDLTQVTPTTQATLYFNLLGFGARTSTVTIDDVKLFTDTQPIPVTNNDTLTTTQNTPLTLAPTQLTTNDTNVTQIQVINQPTHGTLTQTTDGKFTYQLVSTYVGNDSFTYLGFSTDGQISNLATVNITVNNLAPTIETIVIPNQINEGQTIQLKATAKDGGSSDNLTYTWDLGDGSKPVIGQNITYQFVDNGTYNVNLTVTDKDGGITQQSTQIKVDNVAPTATITTPNTTLNQGESLNLGVNYSDAGIKDTHTITWNFGDGSTPVTLTPLGFEAQPNLQSHTFTLCIISWF